MELRAGARRRRSEPGWCVRFVGGGRGAVAGRGEAGVSGTRRVGRVEVEAVGTADSGASTRVRLAGGGAFAAEEEGVVCEECRPRLRGILVVLEEGYV